jgi:aspartate aminotransferase-like enzyme
MFLLPGPVKIHPRVLRAAIRPALAHRGPEFRAVIRGMEDGLRALMQTKASQVAVMNTSATGAMEAAVAGLVGRGDRIIVPHNGKFGERFAQLATRYAGEAAVAIGSPWGQPIDPEAVRVELEKGASAVAMVVNESSTGVRNPVEDVAAACRRHDVPLIADGVTAYGGMDVPTDSLGVDIAVCGSQKALAAPPGLAVVAVSPWAEERLKDAGHYLGLKAHLDKWRKETTPFTPATHTFLALAEALDMLMEETLPVRLARNKRLADAFRTAMARLGLQLVPAPGYESDTITAVRYPAGVEDEHVRGRLRDEWGIVVAGGQDSLKGKIFRVAHMGHVQARELAACVMALEECLSRVAKTPPTGAAAGAFSEAAFD